mmetsp:Transcript_39510/g.113668  ORF Transcript_39510/g.113668 Transcript_39510/m.113668 type:complete len:657 (-) Transcript_39510:155-2125(-)
MFFRSSANHSELSDSGESQSEDMTPEGSEGAGNGDADTKYLMTNPSASLTDIRPSRFALPPASLTFRDLTFAREVKDDRGQRHMETVLQPCSGHFAPSELAALMGPSGCGKTTLLDMLALKKTAKYSGEVWLNGRPRRKKLFRRVAAYVGQEDMMPAHWKVREAIKFNATLKQNMARTHRNEDDWVETLLETFGLTAVKDSYIGGEMVRGISGGQRRRVTLARGIASHASLLFCDEPTSGLSATDAEKCIKALRAISKRLCVTCIVVIHQPRTEVAEMFDTLTLLTSEPGRMIYSGPMSTAQAYWKERGFPVPLNVNPVDWFMDTVTPGTRTDVSGALVQAFEKYQRPFVDALLEEQLSTEGLSVKDMILSCYEGSAPTSSRQPRLGEYALPFCGQFCALLKRKLRLMVRNPMALGLPVAVPVVQGIIVGYMFSGTGHKTFLRQIMFAFCMLTMLCLAGTMGLIVLITERNLMKHESSEKLYSEMAWAIATQIVDVPLALVGALLNVVIMVAFAELELGIFIAILKWSLLLFFVYDSLFAFIGAVAADTRQAQVLASPAVSIFMLFNGFIVTKDDAPDPLKFIFYISPNAYAMEGIVRAMAKEDRFKDDLNTQLVVSHFGYDSESTSRGVIILVTLIILLRIGQLLGLKYLNHIQR